MATKYTWPGAITGSDAAYTSPHMWSADEPITADKVNNIELGVMEALNQNIDIDLMIDGLKSDIGDISTTGSIKYNIY